MSRADRTDTIEIGGRTYRKFIHYPKPVRDGTVRCISCGQIDEPEWHDEQLCPALRPDQPASVPN